MNRIKQSSTLFGLLTIATSVAALMSGAITMESAVSAIASGAGLVAADA